MANNLLQPDSPEILEEAERIKKEANRFIWGTHDDAAIFVLHPLSVDTNKIRNHVAISDAVKYWKEQCKSAVLVSSSAAKSYTTREIEKGSNTIFSCVIADCKDPSKYKVSKDGSMCEMTKEYERQLDRAAKEQKKEEKQQQKQEDNLKETKAEIISSKDNISVGDSITYNDSDYNELKPLIDQWKNACASVVKKTFSNAVSDPEAVPAGKGKSKITCYIRSCGRDDLQVSNNRKSCEPTEEEKQRQKEQERENEKDRCGGRNGTWDEKKGCLCNGKKMPKGETECLSSDGKKYSVKDDGSKKIIDEINTSKQNMKIGASISIPENLLSVNDKINTAISEWEQKCDSIKTDNISSTTTDEKSINGKKKITCIIYNCLPKYTKSKDNKSCVINDNELNDDEKSLKEACEKKEKGKWVIRGETSTCICPKTVDGYFFDKELKKCIIDSDENCPANTKYNEETKTCDTVPGSECTPKDKRASKGKFNSETKQCESAECKNPDKYEVVEGKCLSKNKIEREQQKLQMAAEKDFIADVNKLISAFNTVAEKYKPECSTSDNEGQS